MASICPAREKERTVSEARRVLVVADFACVGEKELRQAANKLLRETAFSKHEIEALLKLSMYLNDERIANFSLKLAAKVSAEAKRSFADVGKECELIIENFPHLAQVAVTVRRGISSEIKHSLALKASRTNDLGLAAALLKSASSDQLFFPRDKLIALLNQAEAHIERQDANDFIIAASQKKPNLVFAHWPSLIEAIISKKDWTTAAAVVRAGTPLMKVSEKSSFFLRNFQCLENLGAELLLCAHDPDDQVALIECLAALKDAGRFELTRQCFEILLRRVSTSRSWRALQQVICLHLRHIIQADAAFILLKTPPSFAAACLQVAPELELKPEFQTLLNSVFYDKHKKESACELLQVAGPLSMLAALCTADDASTKVRTAALRAAAVRITSLKKEDNDRSVLLKAVIEATKYITDSQALRCIGLVTQWPNLDIEAEAAEATISALGNTYFNEKVRAQAAFALSNLSKLVHDDTTPKRVWLQSASAAVATELSRYDADFEAYNGGSRVTASALRAAGYLLKVSHDLKLALQLVRVCSAATLSSLASAKVKRNACLAVGQGFDGLPEELRAEATSALVAFLQAHYDNKVDDQRKALAFAAASLTRAAHDLTDKAAALLAAVRALRSVDADGPFPPAAHDVSLPDTFILSQGARLPDFPSQRLRLFTDLSRLVMSLLSLAVPSELFSVASDLIPHLDFLYLWLCSTDNLVADHTPLLLDKIVLIFSSASFDHYDGLIATLDRFTVRARILRRRRSLHSAAAKDRPTLAGTDPSDPTRNQEHTLLRPNDDGNDNDEEDDDEL